MYINPNIQNTPAKSPDLRRRLRVSESACQEKEHNKERRRRPDRRRQNIPISIPDRRRKADRRQPKLLNAKTAKPEKLNARIGRTIDTRV